MPAEQADLLPPETMPFVMVRLLLRPGATYDEQRGAFAPFDKIAAPLTIEALASRLAQEGSGLETQGSSTRA